MKKINVNHSAILLIMILITIQFNSCREPEIKIERKALDFMLNQLEYQTNSSNLLDSMSMISQDCNYKNFEGASFYSNGNLCMVSELIYNAYSREDFIYNSDNIKSMLSYRDSLLKSNYTPSISLPKKVTKLTFSKFKTLQTYNSFFVIVRQHLKVGDKYLVQIHLVPLEEINYPLKYSFHIYFEGNEIITWESYSLETFDTDFDC